MPNTFYREAIRGNIERAVCIALAAERVEHHGLAGEMREDAFRSILEPLLPRTAAIGKGKMTDSEGRMSRECDLIVYSPQLLAPALGGRHKDCFPFDACAYSIEIKTTLTARDIGAAITNARALRELRLLPPPRADARVQPVYSVVFAFGTDLQTGGAAELDRLLERDPLAYTDPAISMLCVVGKCLLLVRLNENGQVLWQCSPASREYDEVLDFVGVLLNSVQHIVGSRQLPQLGPYLIHPRPYSVRGSDGTTVERPASSPLEVRAGARGSSRGLGQSD